MELGSWVANWVRFVISFFRLIIYTICETTSNKVIFEAQQMYTILLNCKYDYDRD